MLRQPIGIGERLALVDPGVICGPAPPSNGNPARKLARGAGVEWRNRKLAETAPDSPSLSSKHHTFQNSSLRPG